jgi:hypothetical protein
MKCGAPSLRILHERIQAAVLSLANRCGPMIENAKSTRS